MDRPLASELDLDRIMSLVAAHARTRAGRRFILEAPVVPTPEEAAAASRLTREISELIAEGGPVGLAGVDDAAEWLEPDSPPPLEPAALLLLITLARRVASVRRRLLGSRSEVVRLHQLGEDLPDTEALVSWASARLGRDGRIPDDATPELARVRRQAARARREVLERLDELRRSHGEAVADAPPTVRRDRYCLPVRAGARGDLPGLVLASSGSGATLYVEPFQVVELNNDLTDALSREMEEVRRLLAEVAAAFAELADELRAAVEVLAHLDVAQANALFGRAIDGRLVQPEPGAELILRGARHPLLDERLHALRSEVLGEDERRTGEQRVVPLDLRLPENVHTLVVSGPNAGGKTVVLKTAGVMVLMAMHGIPLPVDEGTSIPAFRRVWCHIGDEQNVSADLSTFSGAMAATAALVAEAADDTLVLYDELGTGTDPLEGAALATALLEELTSRRCLTVAATHLAAVGLHAQTVAGMENGAMEYDERGRAPTYRLTLGRPGRSRGLEIAERMGVAGSVLDRARDLLGEEHLQLDRWLDRLERLETELIEARADLDGERMVLRQRREEAEAEGRRLDEERRRLSEELAAERDRLRRRAKEKLDASLAVLDEAVRERRELGRRRRQRLREEALRLDIMERSCGAEAPGEEPRPGDRVRIDAMGGTGELVELRGRQALVTAAGKRLWVDRDLLVRTGERGAARDRAPTSRIEVSTHEEISRELKLLGLDSERARDELERYLDRASAAGYVEVRVVHGHGTGALRRTVQDVCRHHPAVASYRHPPQSRGGTGATEVRLRGADGS